jgi:hypothetical protein
MWTKLEKRNEWIYFIPTSDSVTIVCANREPVEVIINHTGETDNSSGM